MLGLEAAMLSVPRRNRPKHRSIPLMPEVNRWLPSLRFSPNLASHSGTATELGFILAWSLILCVLHLGVMFHTDCNKTESWPLCSPLPPPLRPSIPLHLARWWDASIRE